MSCRHNKAWLPAVHALLWFVACSLLQAAPASIPLKPVLIAPDKEPFVREVLTDQLQKPWAMDFLPDGRLLITEHGGKLMLFSKQNGLKPLADFSDRVATGDPQLGLLDVAVRRINDNTSVYITYTAWREEADGLHYTLCLLRRQFIVNAISPREEKSFCLTPWGKETSQFGGAIAFDKKDNLLLTIGDRAHREQAQNPASRWGKILSLRETEQTFSQDNFHGRDHQWILSSGHRNPQGLFYDKATDTLYSSEHGPEGGDEINIIQQGKNYGWPVITYGHEYNTHEPIGEGTAKAGMEQPLYYYTPSIAPSGMLLYRGNLFPDSKESILVGSLAGMHLNRLVLQNGQIVREERLLKDMKSRIRDIKANKQGVVYVLLENGVLLRLSHKPVDPP